MQKKESLQYRKRMEARAGEFAIRDYNSFVMGVQNYYSMATCVNPDMQTLAYEIKTSIKNQIKYKSETQN